jgi:DNA-directed RNA polymerase specialized sigma24 family protein
MTENQFLAEQFEQYRLHLRKVAYRMLGSVSEADDAVQETWLRLNRSDAGAIENLQGWLTTVVARVSLNALRSRATRNEEPLGEIRVPDPLLSPANVKPVLVNGAAGVLVAPNRRPYTVMGFTVVDGRIATIEAMSDPERLQQLDLTVLDA